MSDKGKCRSRNTCDRLITMLSDANVPEGDILDTCDEEAWPCSSMYQNSLLLFNSISTENYYEALDFISGLFTNKRSLLSPEFDPYAHTLPAPFHCPELDIDVYQSCSVDSCVFFTRHAWTKNCILHYRLRHERDTLSLNELSFLLNREVGSLRADLNKALKGLSHGALKELIASENVEDMVTRIEADRVCVVCEKRSPERTRIINKSNLTYCSQECYRYKPPNVIRVEKEFSLPIEKVLELCVERFANIRNMCSAVGVGQAVFLDMCARYNVRLPTKPSPVENKENAD